MEEVDLNPEEANLDAEDDDMDRGREKMKGENIGADGDW